MSPTQADIKIGEAVVGAFLSLLLGVVGGGMCGAAILVFGAFIGRSGTSWGYREKRSFKSLKHL